MNGNKIGNKGGLCMAQMLQVNFSLRHLDLGHTDLVSVLFKRKLIFRSTFSYFDIFERKSKV